MNDATMDPKAVVLRQVDFYNARDLDGFLSTYREDAVIERPSAGSVVARGTAEMRTGFTKLFACNPELHCAVEGCIVKANFVALSERITGLTTEGARSALAVYEVKDGLIARVWFF